MGMRVLGRKSGCPSRALRAMTVKRSPVYSQAVERSAPKATELARNDGVELEYVERCGRAGEEKRGAAALR